ncbi:MAG: GNAT family N-acetyltransferase [bacterium]
MAIKVRRSRDAHTIWRIITHPRLWPHLSDDGSPSPEKYEPPMHESIYHLVATNGTEKAFGVVSFVPMNAVTYDAHIAILPAAWGPQSVAAAKAAVRWMFKNTQAKRITASIVVKNKLASRVAKKAGFLPMGINPQSFLKDGELQDQMLYGISKEK